MPDVELTFVGTATTLMRLGPFRVLTDPNFLPQGERAYLGYGLSSKRLTEPALTMAQLPPLDLIVLSHLHGDHWDRRARKGLDRTTPVVTTRHAAATLRSRDKFRQALGLRTWQSHAITRDGWTLRITALPATHSRNWLVRIALPPVMGSLLELVDPSGARVTQLYVTGDTMLFDGIDDIGRRHPDIDTAIVHLGGATLLGGVVVTMTGEMGAELLGRLKPKACVPVHYDDYAVFRSGLSDFRRAVDAAGLPVDVRYLNRGDTVALR